MSKISQKIYCAFCKLERKVCVKKSIDWTNVLLSLALSLILMQVIWQKIDAKFILFFTVFLFVAEVFVRIRWRVSLPCPHCAFDPLLYKTDRAQAVSRVKAKLTLVQKDDAFMLKKNNPLLHIPVIRIKKETAPSKLTVRKPQLRESEETLK